LREFMNSHFEKLLLSGLFLIAFGMTVHAMHYSIDASARAWLEQTTGQIIAALLTLMVGSRMTPRNGDSEEKKNNKEKGDSNVN
jgi:membrane protein implicated in regulation of membrane protease activity